MLTVGIWSSSLCERGGEERGGGEGTGGGGGGVGGEGYHTHIQS